MKRLSILFIFFLSGVSALIYQIVWMRKLALFLGVTSHAVAIVLAVFMGGLSLGSWLLGRWGDRLKTPLLCFALLELGIATLGFFSGMGLDHLHLAYVGLVRSSMISPALYPFIRFLFAFLALIVPTTLMGATLPVLIKGFHRVLKNIGQDVGLLYSINTLGAFMGTVLCALFLIRTFGLQCTIYIASAINLTVAVLAFILFLLLRDSKVSAPAQVSHVPEDNGKHLSLIEKVFFLCGFLGLAYEVLWTRYLIYVLGTNSIYAFSAVLAAFLMGIVLGSMLCSFVVDKKTNHISLFALILISAGTIVLFTLALVGKLAGLHLKTTLPWTINLILFLKAMLILMVPAALRGSIFAIAAKICVKNSEFVSKGTGRLYAVNTFGAIFGALAGGFILLPQLGVKNGLLALAVFEVIIGLSLMIHKDRNNILKLKNALIAIVVIVSIVAGFRSKIPAEHALERTGDKLIYYSDGSESSVGVVQGADNSRYLLVDGDIQASMEPKSQTHLRLLGHLPAMLHPSPKNTLVIALGSGVTAGSLLCYPVEQVDIVELSKDMVGVTGYFKEWNNNVLGDSRVNLIYDDGRHYLLTTKKQYDIITTDPMDPDDAGMTSLYSKEYYELVYDHLKDGGTACQWFTMDLAVKDYLILVRTFLAVFPNSYLWEADGTSVIVGIKGNNGIDSAKESDSFNNLAVKKNLAYVGIKGSDDFFKRILADPIQLRSLTGKGALNTDDKPLIEYSLFTQGSVNAKGLFNKKNF